MHIRLPHLATLLAAAAVMALSLASDIVALARALTEVMADASVQKRFDELGITPLKMGSANFTAFGAKQVADWAPAIQAADMKN